MATCAEAFAAYDAKRQQRCRKQRHCDRARRYRNNFAASLGLSVTAIIAVAGALAAAASSGIALPAAIATAIAIIGYAAIFIGLGSLGALIGAIYALIKCESELSTLRDEESAARAALIETNANDQAELRNYLGVAPGC